jgi:hypothetical protein
MIANPVATAGIWGAKNAHAPAPRVERRSGQSRFMSARPGLSSGSVGCVRALASSVAIGDDVPEWRPIHPPMRAAMSHQPMATGTRRLPKAPCPEATVTAASALAAPALSSTVVLRRSVKRTSVVH